MSVCPFFFSLQLKINYYSSSGWSHTHKLNIWFSFLYFYFYESFSVLFLVLNTVSSDVFSYFYKITRQKNVFFFLFPTSVQWLKMSACVVVTFCTSTLLRFQFTNASFVLTVFMYSWGRTSYELCFGYIIIMMPNENSKYINACMKLSSLPLFVCCCVGYIICIYI